MPSLPRVLPLLLVLTLVSAPFAQAQTPPADSLGIAALRAHLRIEKPLDTPPATPPRVPRSHPSSTINTPTAFGPGWKQVYAGVSYQNRVRYSDWHDGLLAVGAGFGNPARTVGLAATLTVLDTYTDFGKDRSLSLKLHRRLPYRSAVAVGYENIWHTEDTDGGDSHYIVTSTVVPLRHIPTAPFGILVISAGLGDDRFLPEKRFAHGDRGVNAFGSVAVRILPPINAIANWSGQDLNLGLSIAPIRSLPVVFTPALLDVTGRAGDGARFAVSASLGYNARR